MTIEQLNADYGIDKQLTFVEGNGGFPTIEIANEKATARISIYGGQVLSFQPISESDDLLFLSKTAYYKEGKAIKGGTPICWPWFGPDPEGLGRASHGIARNRLWNVLSTATTDGGDTKVILGFSDTEETRSIWPQFFELTLEIVVGDVLSIALVTRNQGDQSFLLTQALHTYFTVGDISQVTVVGLDKTRYIDKVDAGAEKTQDGDVAIAQEVDRIYLDVPNELVINDEALGRRLRVTSTGSKSAVVWNPWVDISAKMADLADEDYKRFVCVETTNAANDVVEVAAGEEYRLMAVYSAEQ
ncbi:MAG: D-hexose-6-phosphate mutarotase [Cyanobacteria bacterium P01_E01_bin.6]